MRRIADAGHEIGSHGWSHRSLWLPEGLRATPSVRQVEHVLDHAHPGAIVDLHDAEGVADAPERLRVALPPMIAGLRRLGYELVTVGELLEGAEITPS
ncbi:MAG TPA: polysaccharide deacetylase family protein [Methylomirabilota bacterium]|nr:polysaccharide deacetylase family protein [Methylomirabilota bacterium]